LRSNLICRGIFEDFHAGSKGNLYSKIATRCWPDPGTYDPTNYLGYDRIDDLLHATVNSRGGFFNVNNPDQFVAALNTALTHIATVSSGSAASVAANSTSLNTGTQVYQASFNPEDWSGKLQAFIVNSDGTLSPTPPDPPPPGWEASALLPSLGPSGRAIYTYNPSSVAGVPFLWASLASSQQNDLNTLAGANDGNGALRVDWLRGDQSHEQTTANPGGIFRARTDLLGDIVNSSPVYVGFKDYGYGALSDTEGSSYTSFLASSAYTGRSPMLYVGANDGMLHGFDVGSGQEKFAYIPNAVFPGLSNLTSPNYIHQYYVDGVSGVGDVYDGSAWHTLLAGATGAGGRAVFALDITYPGTFNASKVWWEYTNTTKADGTPNISIFPGTPNTDGSDLGYTLAQPSVVRLQDGHWVVLVANGYNSDNGHAVLFILDALNGNVLQKIDLIRKILQLGEANMPNEAQWWQQRRVDATEASRDGSAG
jgi:type IV pilus assembly protein PilY1